MRAALWRALRDFIERLLIVVLAITAITYAADWISFRYMLGHAKPGSPLEEITIQRIYAVLQKNGKNSYTLAPSQTITCGHTLFPHGGYSPCWYVRSLDGKPIQM